MKWAKYVLIFARINAGTDSCSSSSLDFLSFCENDFYGGKQRREASALIQTVFHVFHLIDDGISVKKFWG